jgi:regulator of RNase E activity RraB
MNKIILLIIVYLVLTSSLSVAQQVKNMDELISENMAVITRIIEDGVDLSVPYNVEFIAVFPTAAAADKVAMMYVADSKMGQKFINIETRPGEEQGMELLLVKSMLVTTQSISEFESQLFERAKVHGGYADGWGMLSD